MRTTFTNFLSITASILLYVVVVVVVVVVPDNFPVVTATKIRGSSSGSSLSLSLSSSTSSSSPLLEEDYLSKGGEEERATAITARKSTVRRLQNPKASEKNGVSSAPSPIPTKGVDYDPFKRDKKDVDEDKGKERRNTNIVKKTKELKNKNVEILPMTRGIGSRYINNDTNKYPKKGLLKQAARGPKKLTKTSTALPTKIGDRREPTTTVSKFSRSGGDFGTFSHKNKSTLLPLTLPSATIAQTRSVGNARIDINNKINNGDNKTGGGIIEKRKKKAFKFEKESKKKLVKKDYEEKKYIKKNDKKAKGDDRKERLKDEKKLKKYEYAN